jgi:hypothetical protein
LWLLPPKIFGKLLQSTALIVGDEDAKRRDNNTKE